MGERRVVVGLGAWARGDDAVGLMVAERLRLNSAAGARVTVGCADAMALVAAVDGADTAVLVDALEEADAPAGTIRCLDLTHRPPPRAPGRTSSHGDALATGWRLARALGVLPARTTLVGIVGARFDLGAPLSRAVRAAVDAASERATAALLVSA